MKIKAIRIIGILVIGAIILWLFFISARYALVDVGGNFFLSEVVRSSEKMQKGLSGRANLCEFCAMLFDFHEKGQRNFWMKGMKFDLDLIWIADSKIVYIEKKASHKSQKIFDPDVEADYVLEIKAGICDDLGLETGDEVRIY